MFFGTEKNGKRMLGVYGAPTDYIAPMIQPRVETGERM